MKRLITLAIMAAAAFAVACGSGGTANGNGNGAGDAAAVIKVETLLDAAADLTGKQVTVEGTCTHICQHGGRKIFLKGSDQTKSIRIEASDKIGVFDAECVDKVVRVTGRLVEDRIDENYLDNWERSMAADTDEESGTSGEGGCDTEKQARGESLTASTAQRIADFRARIAQRKQSEGKDYLSFYHVAAESYEILK